MQVERAAKLHLVLRELVCMMRAYQKCRWRIGGFCTCRARHLAGVLSPFCLLPSMHSCVPEVHSRLLFSACPPVPAPPRAVWASRCRSALVFAFFAMALLWWATAAHAVTELRTFIDSDNNAATGCTVSTPAGSFAGADIAAVTRIDFSETDLVGNVAREVCQSGVLVTDPSFVPLSPLRWPVGVGAAGVERDVVETYMQLLAPSGAVRLGFSASTTDASLAPSALIAANGSAGGSPIQLSAASFSAVPALGAGGLLILACVLGAAAYRFAPVRRFASSGVAMCLVLGVGLAWAAMVRDGATSDWNGAAPVATGSATGPLQFAAVYARLEGATLHLRYDIDLGLRDGEPKDDGTYTTTVGVPLPVNAPGVLGNDVLGSPPMQVREFRAQGESATTPAGGSTAFAGGALQVNANGGFTVDAPAAPGLYRFEYRARNRFFAGGWAVATVAVAPASTCGDGTRSAGEACDDGNVVTETSCAYGTPNCSSCNSTCSGVLNLTGPYCGDSSVNGPELCDDGNNLNETSCAYGTQNCTTCNSTCSGQLTLSGPYCGDGILNGPEVCDDGNNVDETACPYGVRSCTQCTATCTATLSLTGEYCGDGKLNGAEVCDDGNNISGDGCNATCSGN